MSNKEKQRDRWINKYGYVKFEKIVEIFKKPNYVLIIQKKYKVCERTIKYWKIILK